MTHNELLQLARQLQPIIRTGWAVECCQCHNAITFGQLYFTNVANPNNDEPWCRDCGVTMLLAMQLIPWRFLIHIPRYGAVPPWMSSAAAEDWVPPTSVDVRPEGPGQERVQ